ncbi:MAG: hypothetical protein WCI22_14670 [Actinomycetota bacterium]
MHHDNKGGGSRNTFWWRTFAAARDSNGWARVPRHYTRATAAQLASDIANSHRRQMTSLRVRGVLLGEQWATRWEPASDDAAGDHVVWIRLIEVASGERH